MLVVERKLTKLPSKYQKFPVNSVTPVNLPVKNLMQLSKGSTVALDLPMGQFNITHDNRVSGTDASQIWVGHLADEGEGYRLFVSQGAAGTMGFITTPDGTYNIESDNKGQTYLIDTSKLQHAGYAGDSIVPTQALMDEIASIDTTASSDATVSLISQLQAAVATAQTTLNTANALVITDQGIVSTDSTQLSTALTNYNAANSNSSKYYVAYYSAVMSYYASPSNTTLTSAYAAQAAYQSAASAANVAYAAYIAANTAYNTANTNLKAAKAAAATALTAYNQAAAALNNALNPPAATATTTAASNTASNTPTVATTTKIDLLVVYTTSAYTDAYAQQRINLLVAASNQAYISSGINLQLNLVNAQSTTYTESNSNVQALTDLTLGNGAFSTINAARSQYGADLVFLFRPLYAQTAGSCGTTYLQFANGGGANSALAYGTIGDGNSVDIPGYYCTANAFTHEIGHSLGLVHDRPNAGNSVGVFPYSYAWGVSGTFGTIMSYDLPVLMYFSTPLLSTQCASQPCGFSQTDPNSSDQTSSVNYTAPIVANFLPSLTP